MQGQVNIIGQIGSDADTKGVELIDVITQVQNLPADCTEFNLLVTSPGGFKDVGDQIYNYLTSLKPKKKINAIQAGDIGSIATKIFMAGDSRQVNSNYEFFIHNPWADIGPVDANAAAQATLALQQSKLDLLAFYCATTGSPISAIEPLMDNQTGLTADQALALKFATEVAKPSIKSLRVFAKINNMKNQNQPSALEKLLNDIKALVTVKALDIKLKDGTSLVSDAKDMATIVGSKVTTPDSQIVQDGTYVTADGYAIGVANGAVTEYATVNEEQSEGDLPMAKRIESLESSVKALAESVSSFIKASQPEALTKAFDDKILALRKEIGVKHVPASRAFQGNGQPRLTPIQAKQKELLEKEKNNKR